VIAISLLGKKAAGRLVLIDDADYDLAARYRWYVWEVQRRDGRVDGPYAMATMQRDGRRANVFMHKLITGWPVTDHANGDGLDNRRSNLRPATNAQNNHNQRPQAGHSSQYKGVTWHKQCRKWQAVIRTGGKGRYLGVFVSEEDAAAAYAAAALDIQGEYAYSARPEPCKQESLQAVRRVDQVTPIPLRRTNTSGVRGVVYQPSISASKPWRAQIMVNRRGIYLGLFATKDEAAAARQEAERRYFGDARAG